MENDFNEVRDLIDQNLALEQQTGAEEEEAFIRLIAERVAELMETNMELFFNHLYRMDVDERQIRNALDKDFKEGENVYLAIAQLIYKRQKKRLETKKKYKQDNIDYWADEW